MIPTEPVTELRNGKKYTIDRVFLPGYVLVEMDLDNDLWHVIKNTPRVTGFLGTGDNPVALSEQEVSSILFRSDNAKDKPSMKIKFAKGEQVRINEGPFANFSGTVDDANDERQTLKVMVSIFGRSTPRRNRVLQGRQDRRVIPLATLLAASDNPAHHPKFRVRPPAHRHKKKDPRHGT